MVSHLRRRELSQKYNKTICYLGQDVFLTLLIFLALIRFQTAELHFTQTFWVVVFAVDIGRISELISNATCFKLIRENRWPDGLVLCPHCDSDHIKKNGHDTVQKDCQHYQCKQCHRYFDDLTNTVFAGHHQPLKVWVSCLYLMGLNVSNSQIAKELDLSLSDVHEMTTQLRTTVVERKPDISLEGEVEFDEVYIVAGHKGHPEALKKSAAPSPKEEVKRGSGQGNSRKRQASRSGNDSARRSGHCQYAG